MSQDAMKEVLSHILERLESIEATLAKAPRSTGPVEGATPRKTNEKGDRVYVTDGCNKMNDRDTGEDGFWVTTSGGKPIPVDVQGYALFDEKRPLLQGK